MSFQKSSLKRICAVVPLILPVGGFTESASFLGAIAPNAAVLNHSSSASQRLAPQDRRSAYPLQLVNDAALTLSARGQCRQKWAVSKLG